MLFKPEFIPKIVLGEKTQTRRPVKEGEYLLDRALPFHGTASEEIISESHYRDIVYKVFGLPIAVYNKGRIKYQVGKDYSVQPKMYKSGVWWCPECKNIVKHKFNEITKTNNYDCLCTINSEFLITFNDNWKPLRITIKEIWKEPLWDITNKNAIAEGFGDCKNPRDAFLRAVHEIYKKPYVSGNDSWNPEMWALDFEVKK